MGKIMLLLGTASLLALCLFVFCFCKKPCKSAHTITNITLTSPSFTDGSRLPTEFTCEGTNVSPALTWSTVPAGTQSFVIICDDPDAPGKTWVHWVIFNIPANKINLEQAIPVQPTLANGARQGINDFGKIGYGGACPPKGHEVHRYVFKVYALDKMLNLQPGATKDSLERAMQGHILGQGKLIGSYSR